MRGVGALNTNKRMKKRREQQPTWTPFEKAQRAILPTGQDMGQLYVNSRYTVIRQDNLNESMVSLSVRRNDRLAIHDWRDLQRIKNELVGPEHEGFEIYPAESRLTDTANQYYLWVFLDPLQRVSVGFQNRLVSTGGGSSRQRHFAPGETPADAVSQEELERRTKEQYGL